MKVAGVEATRDPGTWASPETTEDKRGTKDTETVAEVTRTQGEPLSLRGKTTECG